MPAGTSHPFVLVRVPRGEPCPSEDVFLDALEQDRGELGLAPANGEGELEVTGPFPVVVDGEELDEYAAWER